MDREIDLATADRDVLIVVRQQVIIERLEKRIAQLEAVVPMVCGPARLDGSPTSLRNSILDEQHAKRFVWGSTVAALREEARLPFRTIQWYLGAVHGLHLSRLGTASLKYVQRQGHTREQYHVVQREQR